MSDQPLGGVMTVEAPHTTMWATSTSPAARLAGAGIVREEAPAPLFADALERSVIAPGGFAVGVGVNSGVDVGVPEAGLTIMKLSLNVPLAVPTNCADN